jgi:hypothetical protein
MRTAIQAAMLAQHYRIIASQTHSAAAAAPAAAGPLLLPELAG